MKFEPQASNLPTDPMERAYLEAAEWCGIDEDQQHVYNTADSIEWSPEALRKAEQDCDDFRSVADELLENISFLQVGHDFWLTRNGHGAGFWDRGLGKVGDTLTELCKPYGEQYVHVGKDGTLHLEP